MGERTVTATVGGSATFMLRTEGGVGGICTTPTDKLEEEEGEEGGVVRTEEPLQPTKYAHYISTFTVFSFTKYGYPYISFFGDYCLTQNLS